MDRVREVQLPAGKGREVVDVEAALLEGAAGREVDVAGDLWLVVGWVGWWVVFGVVREWASQALVLGGLERALQR